MAKIGQHAFCNKPFIAVIVLAMSFLSGIRCTAQNFCIAQKTDSLWVLSLCDNNGHPCSTWELPYPVYRFCIADIDGDGIDDAVVGVVKGSRFFPQPSRRVFIFKNYHGLVRPLWLGSRLRGDLMDFVTVGNRIRAIEKTLNGKLCVSDYVWHGFGMDFAELILTSDSPEQCLKLLHQPSNIP